MKNDKRVKNGAAYLVLLLVWAAALSAVIYLSLTRHVSSVSRELPVYCVETGEKTAALTFNCAWDDTGLDTLLETLKNADVKATFFVVGDFAEKYPDAVRKIHNAGHVIGNHSMRHKDPVKMSYAELLSDMNACNELLYLLTGTEVTLYRAPSGSYNGQTVEAARALGMTAIQWDADSIDWKDPTPAEIQKRILSKTGGGSILLFHVGKTNTVEALPGIITELKRNGFSLVTVPELLPAGETYIDADGRLHGTR